MNFMLVYVIQNIVSTVDPIANKWLNIVDERVKSNHTRQ